MTEAFQSSEGFAKFKAGGMDVTVIKGDITTIVAPGAEFVGIDPKGAKKAERKGVKASGNNPDVVRLVKPGATVELFHAGQPVVKISH